MREALALLRRVFGMPDYEAYVTYLRTAHPSCSVPSEREFFEEFVKAKSAGGVMRCC
jgi:uncharacterized short protein YbdD (DUF466 family)